MANAVTTASSATTAPRPSVTVQNASLHAAQLAASTRYALSRFPFPPVIIRFNTVAAKPALKKIQEELSAHLDSAHHSKVTFLHVRASTVRCNANELDILLYVKDAKSFGLLLDELNWPPTLVGEGFSFPSLPSIPPQLSLIIRNVDASANLEEITAELKSAYPSTRNVIRLKNKFGKCIDLVKVELSSSEERQALLDSKRFYVNHMSYVVGEYLAPANVLICSKCCGIGHFRKQCPDALDTCKKCGQACPAIKDHQCNAPLTCKHCGGDHLANSLKCPVIRAFRADLTRKLLNKNDTHVVAQDPSSWSSRASHTARHTPAPPIGPSSSCSWQPTNTPMASMSAKLDSLIVGLASLHDTLAKVCDSNARFEGFMVDQSNRVQILEEKVSLLQGKGNSIEAELAQCKVLCVSHQNGAVLTASLAKQVILPAIEVILLTLGRPSKNGSGRALDADLQCRLERYREQVTKAMEGKAHSQ